MLLSKRFSEGTWLTYCESLRDMGVSCCLPLGEAKGFFGRRAHRLGGIPSVENDTREVDASAKKMKVLVSKEVPDKDVAPKKFLPLSREKTVGSSATNGCPMELSLLSSGWGAGHPRGSCKGFPPTPTLAGALSYAEHPHSHRNANGLGLRSRACVIGDHERSRAMWRWWVGGWVRGFPSLIGILIPHPPSRDSMPSSPPFYTAATWRLTPPRVNVEGECDTACGRSGGPKQERGGGGGGGGREDSSRMMGGSLVRDFTAVSSCLGVGIRWSWSTKKPQEGRHLVVQRTAPAAVQWDAVNPRVQVQRWPNATVTARCHDVRVNLSFTTCPQKEKIT
ncbi:hypothetical protein BHE74_00005922 [Ensete ventricosum]|nr:hypothetical protein BHE74_00005922 [Ensete ventricosum]